MSRRMTSRGRAMRILTRRCPAADLAAPPVPPARRRARPLARDGRPGASGGRGPRRQLRRRRPGRGQPRRRRERRRRSPSLPTAASSWAGRGRTQPAGRDGIVARLTPQGAIDTTYGRGSGWSLLDYSPADAVKRRRRAAGRTDPGRRLRLPGNGFVARLDESGRRVRPDLRRRGRVHPPRARHRHGYSSVALQPDGRILAVGTVPPAPPAAGGDIAAVRLTSAGTLDQSSAAGT